MDKALLQDLRCEHLHFEIFVGIACWRISQGREIASQEEVDHFVGIGRARQQTTQQIPTGGAVAGFFRQFPLNRGQGLLAGLQRSGRKFQQPTTHRKAVLAQDQHPAIRQYRHGHAGTGMANAAVDAFGTNGQPPAGQLERHLAHLEVGHNVQQLGRFGRATVHGGGWC